MAFRCAGVTLLAAGLLLACGSDDDPAGASGDGGAGTGGSGGSGGAGGTAGASSGGTSGSGGSAGASAGGTGGGTGGAAGAAAASGAAGAAGAAGAVFNPATDPTVTINHPGDMECRVVNQAVPMVVVATDPQDGDLTSAVQWNSDLEGNIGTGTGFSFTPTQVGNQVITASVSDSDGNPGSDKVTLVIVSQQSDCP